MIIVLRPSISQNDIKLLSEEIISKYDVKINPIVGTETTVIGLVGETQSVDIHKLRSMDIVEKVIRVQEPYKKANRAFHPQDTIIDVQGRKIGEGNFSVIAGPALPNLYKLQVRLFYAAVLSNPEHPPMLFKVSVPLV